MQRDYSRKAAVVFARVEGIGNLSGTAYFYRGHLLTAGHVCAAYDEISQTLPGQVGPMQLRFAVGNSFVTSGQYVPKRYLFDEDHDVCELSAIEFASGGLENLRAGAEPDIGDPVSIVGAPMGIPLFRTDGYVAQTSVHRLLVSAAAYGGNSGSPVLDAEGRLVGMLVAGFREYPFISFCVPLVQIDEFLSN